MAGSQDLPCAIDDGRWHLQQLGKHGGDLSETAIGELDFRKALVYPFGKFHDLHLAVGQHPHHRHNHLCCGHIRGHLEQRQPQTLGQSNVSVLELTQKPGLDSQGGGLALGQGLQQVGDGIFIVPQGVAGSDEQLAAAQPGLNVRYLHAVHAGNGVVKPRLPCQKPAFAQAAGFHRFTNSQHCCLLLSCNLCSDFTIPTSKLQIITITFFTPSETHSDMCLSFFLL